MKLKQSLALLALMVPLTASAIPIHWNLWDVNARSGDTLLGSFAFDASTDLYSDVDIDGGFGDHYSALTGDADSAFGTGDIFADELYLYFDQLLTDAGGTVTGEYDEFSPDLGNINLRISRVASVPEPSTLALLGLGLAALGFGRRSQS